MLAFNMHLALSIMHLTLLSANIIALLEDISSTSLSPILATELGSNSAKASLHQQYNNFGQLVLPRQTQIQSNKKNEVP